MWSSGTYPSIVLNALLHDRMYRELPFVYHDGVDSTKVALSVVSLGGVWICATMPAGEVRDVKQFHCQMLML